MFEPVVSPEEITAAAARIEAWLAVQQAENPLVEAIERDESGVDRWFVRLRSPEKGPFTIWLLLRQRTLHHETYVFPAPMENEAAFYEHLLRRNLKLHGVSFAIGAEDAVFLLGQLPVDRIDDDALDWVLGTHYATVDQFFRPAMRIGFASLFKG
jgi:hypothetical protein